MPKIGDELERERVERADAEGRRLGGRMRSDAEITMLKDALKFAREKAYEIQNMGDGGNQYATLSAEERLATVVRELEFLKAFLLEVIR